MYTAHHQQVTVARLYTLEAAAEVWAQRLEEYAKRLEGEQSDMATAIVNHTTATKFRDAARFLREPRP